MTSLTNLITYEQLLDKEIAKLEAIISSAPEGHLVSRASHNGSYVYTKKIHLPDGKFREVYLGKGPNDEAIQLANKMMAKKRLPFLLREKEIVRNMLMNRKKESVAANYLNQHPGLGSLLTSSVFLTDQKIRDWKQAPYKKSRKHPENLRFSTVVPNLMVRSKAEADIIACLERYGIAYRYEEIITIGDIEYAMDFTLFKLPHRTNMVLGPQRDAGQSQLYTENTELRFCLPQGRYHSMDQFDHHYRDKRSSFRSSLGRHAGPILSSLTQLFSNRK